MDLKQSFIIALTLGVIGLTSWEIYWRSQGKVPTFQDDKALWASNRARVEKLTSEDYVFAGSSRIHFDVQLDVWEEYTGKRPVQLSMGGASPLPTIRDIARNTNFAGTLVVGITPPLFFSTTFPQAPPILGIQERVDYYHDRTYAQRINHWLSMPLQRNLATIHSYEDLVSGNFDLKSLLQNIKIGNRTGHPQMPPFPDFGFSSEERNVRMLDRMVTDPAFAQSIIDVWMFCLKGGPNMPPPDREGTTAFFLEDVALITQRGGKVILLRCPSAGQFRELESNITPREAFWDQLVVQSGLPAYHFEDFGQLQGLRTPELSHLAAPDADIFTRELIAIMIKDEQIPNHQTN
ncbi:hypothetical protein [Spongiimicrobium sp. 3-5]|uniref:hypothetical protein n=1 Tax=Spongiimicrobium sp. 3-5 TaxID=3332596 RepID=UPI00397F3AA0